MAKNNKQVRYSVHTFIHAVRRIVAAAHSTQVSAMLYSSTAVSACSSLRPAFVHADRMCTTVQYSWTSRTMCQMCKNVQLLTIVRASAHDKRTFRVIRVCDLCVAMGTTTD